MVAALPHAARAVRTLPVSFTVFKFNNPPSLIAIAHRRALHKVDAAPPVRRHTHGAAALS